MSGQPSQRLSSSWMRSATSEISAVTAAASTLRHSLVDGRRHQLTPPARPCSGDAVVLVHGYASNPTIWRALIRRLHAAGFTDVRCFSYSVQSPGIEAVGERLVEEVREAFGSMPPALHLVGHSLGGLIARWAVGHGLADAVQTTATIGTPHGGVPVARLGPGALLRDLRPGSAVLRHLDRIPLASSVRWTAYWSPRDELVPARRAVLPAGADDDEHITNVCIPDRGHVALALSRLVADDLISRLLVHTVADALPLSA